MLLIAGIGYRYLGDTAFPARPDIHATELGPLIDPSANAVLPVLVLHPPKTRLEAFWSAALAEALHGRQEVRISHGRIDVLTSTYAIEVDWLNKWHEGLGQAPLRIYHRQGARSGPDYQAERMALERPPTLQTGGNPACRGKTGG